MQLYDLDPKTDPVIWAQTLHRAQPWVEFLKRGNFFSRPYHGHIDALVTTDPQFAMLASTGREWPGFASWPDLIDDLPASKVYYEDLIAQELRKVDYFGYMQANYNGADIKLLCGQYQVFEDQIYEIVYRAFSCYANDFFPDLMQQIVHVYLHDGYPCGWLGTPSQGKLLVYSNH